MRDECDFSKGTRGAVIASPGKTRITIMLDDDIIDEFASRAGSGYQTLIHAALRAALGSADEMTLTVGALRQVLREELQST